MKFLVLWEIEIAHLGPEAIQAVMRMPEYAKKTRDQGKLTARYHVVGKHGGAWIMMSNRMRSQSGCWPCRRCITVPASR